jgi:hypothetical protein
MATKRSVGTLGEADLKGKKVFVRADLNVPLDDAQKITDDTRIRASVPTIKFLLEKGAKVVLASHLVSVRSPSPYVRVMRYLSISLPSCFSGGRASSPASQPRFGFIIVGIVLCAMGVVVRKWRAMISRLGFSVSVCNTGSVVYIGL